MKLQVEKYLAAGIQNLAHDRGAHRHVKLAADLEHPGKVVKAFYQAHGVLARADIKCNRDLVFHCSGTSHPCQGACRDINVNPGYAKNAYPGLQSRHASGVSTPEA